MAGVFSYSYFFELEGTTVQASLGVTALLYWFASLYYLIPYKSTGPFVLMLVEVISETALFFLVLMVTVAGAIHSFSILMLNQKEGFFGGIWQTAFTVVNAVMFGAFELDMFQETPQYAVACGMLILVLIYTTVLLMNLLIGKVPIRPLA